ncbi:MAG: peptidase M64 N-terminal domain-containing protein, partial [Thermoanaerobaculia bacterium]
MRHRLVIGLLIGVLSVCASATASALEFSDFFTGATMRVDLYHTGNATMEYVAIDRVRVEGPWPGSRTQLIDYTNLGKYFFEVVDLATQQVIYSRGFASIYGEWETTGEARSGTVRTLPEALRFPEPLKPIQARLRKRGQDQSFSEIWSTTIDPGSRFVHRAPVPTEGVWSVFEHGEPARKVDLLILGDGYTKSEMGQYHQDAKRVAEELFSVEPFASRRESFNVWAIDSPA